MVSRASPQRTCVGCRERADASELLRVVAVERDAEPPGRGQGSGTAVFSVVPDPARRRPGRGAHLHPDPGCLALAMRRRAFGRALRITGVIDAEPLVGYIAEPTHDHRRRTGRSEQPMVGPPTPERKVGRSA